MVYTVPGKFFSDFLLHLALIFICHNVHCCKGVVFVIRPYVNVMNINDTADL